ncbi:hypothetical protein DH09_13290 [Bacillaceae bacterium JMAK1]|nr:hypothetical protein DH09_13290 [Bacillaceae bacterium JMAK1]
MINPNLKGKTILITGGNSGIGSAITQEFAAMGGKVVVHYYDKEEKATQLVHSIQENGGKAIAIYADLRQEQDVDQLMERSIEAFGTVDTLINNAAACVLDTIFDTVGATIDDHFEMNARVPVQLMNRFVLMHKEQGKKEGSIINISTDASQKFAGQISYGASKAALEAYTRSVAIEAGPHGITVNCISPGPTQTGYIDEQLERMVMPDVPMRRLGEPKDIAEAAVFFASKQARWITGQVLLVSGGHYI